MIEHSDEHIFIRSAAGNWEARHLHHPYQAPAEIKLNNDLIISGSDFYIDSLGPSQVLLKSQTVRRKSGGAVVAEKGFFPFGSQVGFSQTTRYAANHARFTFDLKWPARQVVERHLGIGSILLPGSWRSFFCIPPARHLTEGVEPYTSIIPELEPDKSELMIGHWHRPPLALVFHRNDGVRVEIGLGSDVWRWRESLEAGVEMGSYKIILCPEGLRIVREPLMTCSPFQLSPRIYRFKWYMAWDALGKGSKRTSGKLENSAHELSFSENVRVESAFRLEEKTAPPRLERTSRPCWLSPVMEREVKRRVRRLANQDGKEGRGGEGEMQTLLIGDFFPGVCCDAAHLQRGRRKTLVHWDMDAILDLAEWIKRQLGDNWRILPAPCRLESELPSLGGAFSTLGFEVE